MEEFDLVNEKDEVIGTTNKEKSHANAEIHRVVAVYVLTPEGELYMQDHLASKKWDHSVGGHVSKGESYDTSVEREASEELGLTGPYEKVVHFFADETKLGGKFRHYFTVYECTPRDWKFIPNDEVQIIKALPIEEIVSQMNETPEKFTRGFLSTMAEYLKVKQLPWELHLRAF